MQVETAQVDEPLRLSCGHLLTAVVTSREGTSYCSGCEEREEREELLQAEAEATVPALTHAGEEDADQEPAEDPVEAEPGGRLVKSRDQAHEGVTQVATLGAEAEAKPLPPHEATERSPELPGEGGHSAISSAEGSQATPPLHTASALDASAEGAESAASGQGLVQPFRGTRGEAPGARGCWALNNRGEPCGAAKRNDSDFCNAHGGYGVSRDPLAYSSEGHEARRRNLETRARMRVMLGNTRMDTPRGALKAHAHVHAERLAGRAIGAALDPEADPLKAGSLALSIIREADPAVSGVLDVSTSLDPEGIESMSFRELLAVAQAHGIEVGSTPPALPA